jgi:hypothetical protein
MDPISISASIIAVLQLTGTVISYLKEAKSAPEERKKLLNETICIESFLFVLKDKAESPRSREWSETLKSLKLRNGPLTLFQQALERLASKLAPPSGWEKIGKELRWPFQKQEIQDIIATIERQKTLFILALQNDHM